MPVVVGSTVGGKYRIDRAIAAGGMGTVVGATHIELGSPVALKFLSERIRDSPNSVERFTREARACAQLRSEHVCRVSDFGIEDGVPYIAMELLEGIDLARKLEQGRVGPVAAVDYVLQACVGLAEAHGLGIVHRDLKPSNLFLSRRADGSPLVKVLDFGIAKIPVEADRSLTQTATVIGSPGYMAPEQLRSSRSVDARADVWALGVILYELIASRHPFHASALTEVAVRIAMDEPMPLTEASPALRDVVMRCLAKDPDHRYADVVALASALAPFAVGGRDAATIANRFLMDGVENRRTVERPALPSQAPTVRDRPKQPAPPQRSSAGFVFVVIGVAIVLGATAVVLVLAFGTTEPTAISEPAPPPKPSPPVDAAVVAGGRLDITVTGVVVATIVVDGIEWGVGQRISREVAAGAHEIEVRAAGKQPVRRRVEGPMSITIDVPAEKPPGRDPMSVIKPIEKLGATVAAVNETVQQGKSHMKAKGLLNEDVPNANQLSEKIRVAVKALDLPRAQKLADQLLASIDAIQIDRTFILTKYERLRDRATGLAPGDLKKQIDDLLADAMKQVNDRAFVPANITLGVIAGLIASSLKH